MRGRHHIASHQWRAATLVGTGVVKRHERKRESRRAGVGLTLRNEIDTDYPALRAGMWCADSNPSEIAAIKQAPMEPLRMRRTRSK